MTISGHLAKRRKLVSRLQGIAVAVGVGLTLALVVLMNGSGAMIVVYLLPVAVVVCAASFLGDRLLRCPNCNTKVHDEAPLDYCQNCGSDFFEPYGQRAIQRGRYRDLPPRQAQARKGHLRDAGALCFFTIRECLVAQRKSAHWTYAIGVVDLILMLLGAAGAYHLRSDPRLLMALFFGLIAAFASLHSRAAPRLKCPRCGTPVASGAPLGFCAKCGQDFGQPYVENPIR